MSGALFRVSGIDANEGAEVVFVWCRNQSSHGHTLLGSGHVVRADGRGLPNGISSGQFSVTFPLPLGCSAADIVVSDDKSGMEFLTDVSLTACSVLVALQSGLTTSPASPMRADATPASNRLATNGQVGMTHNTESRR